jgi:hypothetical protein
VHGIAVHRDPTLKGLQTHLSSSLDWLVARFQFADIWANAQFAWTDTDARLDRYRCGRR